MVDIKIKGNPLWVVIILLISVIYFAKVTLFPDEVEICKRKITRLASASSYHAIPNATGIASRLGTFKNSVSPLLKIDLSDYMGKLPEEAKTYTAEDVIEASPAYFKYFLNVNVLIKDVQKIAPREFQLYILLRGRTIQESVNDAYNVQIKFDKKWIITEVKVLKPPTQTGGKGLPAVGD